MHNEPISLRRTVERRIPGYIHIIQGLLYASVLIFTVLGSMFGFIFLPLALGTLFGSWYFMGEARVLYEYRLEGYDLTVMRISGMRSRRREVAFVNLDLHNLIAAADEGAEMLEEAEKRSLSGPKRRVTYDVSAHDPARGCALLYAMGTGAEAGRIVRVCFQPAPDLTSVLRRLCPGKVMIRDENL